MRKEPGIYEREKDRRMELGKKRVSNKTARNVEISKHERRNLCHA